MSQVPKSIYEKIIERKSDDPFPYGIDSIEFYPDDTGHSNFYGTRVTDGGRPALYARLLEGKLPSIKVLSGLGCGDSAVEGALLQKYGSTNVNYFALDCSDSMLLSTKRRLLGLGDNLHLIKCDFTDPEMTDLLIAKSQLIASDGIVSSVLGRTFGNHPLDLWGKSALRLTQVGDLLIDYYTVNSPREAEHFRNRMMEICRDSKSFFVHPLVILGMQSKDILLQVEFRSTSVGLCADFFTVLDEQMGPVLLHQIRGIDSRALFSELEELGITSCLEISLPDQLAPMSLSLLRQQP